MATIFIERLRVETLIGICDWEREVPQELLFDISMECDIAAAAKSDAIADALDYAAVAEQVTGFVQDSKRLLLEPLLAELAADLLAQFSQIESLTVTVRKPQAIAAADCAGIRYSLSRN